MKLARFPFILLGLTLVPACGDKEGSGEASSSSTNGTTSTTSDDTSTSTSTTGDTTPTTSSSTTTTSDTDATVTDSDSGTSGGCGSFVCPPDDNVGNECDPKIQDCPDGEKCTAWANDGSGFWNANKCVPVSGQGVGGDMCTVEGGGVSGIDDCAKGFICMNTNQDGIGSCVKFCTGDDTDCDPGFICAIYNDGVLPICLDECHPLLQDCPDMQSCIDTPNGNFICFNDASGAGGADGDPCPPLDGENSCDPGMWCGAGSDGCNDPKCCTPYCDITGADPCTGNDQCISFYDDPNNAPPMYMDVGVCVVP